MNDIAESVGKIIVGLLLIFVGAVFSGTILWLIWNDSVGAMFPKAVETGVLAATLTWWQAVKVSWVFAILIKATTTVNSK